MTLLEPLILRWVWSPVGADGVPACAQYVRRWRMPVGPATPGGSALVLVEGYGGHVHALEQDPSLTVLDSLHMSTPAPAAVIAAHAAHGATAGMTVAQLMHHLGRVVHPVFSPDR